MERMLPDVLASSSHGIERLSNSRAGFPSSISPVTGRMMQGSSSVMLAGEWRSTLDRRCPWGEGSRDAARRLQFVAPPPASAPNMADSRGQVDIRGHGEPHARHPLLRQSAFRCGSDRSASDCLHASGVQVAEPRVSASQGPSSFGGLSAGASDRKGFADPLAPARGNSGDVPQALNSGPR